MAVHWPRSIAKVGQGADFSRRPALAGLAIAATLIVAIVSALRLHDAIARERENVVHNRLVLDVARARTAENVTLARTDPVAKNGDVRASVERIFARQAVSYRVPEAQESGGTLKIVIEAAPFDALVRALDALSREEGMRVTDATLTARVDPGTVRAEVELAR